MNRAAFLVLGLALLGNAPPPTALVAGTVRDQHGAPVAAATIVLYAAGKKVASTATGADGTFAVPGVAAESVQVDCTFCEQLREPVPSDGIVIALVRRYDALASDGPARSELQHLPYAYAESALSLTPFVVLSESQRVYPGPQLTDRRLSAAGGLLLLNGIPDYDIATNISPYLTIPERDFTSVGMRRSSDAYLYGDTANNGLFAANTPAGSAAALTGSGATLRLTQASSTLESSAAYSSGHDGDDRMRADAGVSFALPGVLGDASLGMGQINDLPAAGPAFNSEFSAAQVSLQRTSGIDLSGSLTADRGTYYYDSELHPAEATWSDIDARAILRAHAVVAPFALVEARRSTAQSTLGQVRGVAGFSLESPHWSVLGALGSDAVSYAQYANVDGTHETTHDSVLSATWTPGASFSVEASASSGYQLPTFSAAYNPLAPYPSFLVEDGIVETTVTFSDTRRLRLGLTALRFTDDLGASGSAGASLAWQIAPRVSLRTWLLHVADTQHGSASVGSTWLTYDTGAFRIDAIERRDLRGLQPDSHFDASISGALSRRLWWFVGSELRNAVRSTDIGLRW